jgi:hypothetical protein
MPAFILSSRIARATFGLMATAPECKFRFSPKHEAEFLNPTNAQVRFMVKNFP